MRLNVEAELQSRLQWEEDWHQTAEWFMTAVIETKPTWPEMTKIEQDFFKACWDEQQAWLAEQTKH
jgi:hypothetical protein